MHGLGDAPKFRGHSSAMLSVRLRALLLAGAIVVTACATRPNTQLVIRIRSDIPQFTELLAVRVSAVRQRGAPILDNQRYALGVGTGMFRLPGEIGLIPRDPNDTRAVDVTVTAELNDPAMTFSREYTVSIARERVTVLDVFLARRCIDATARVCPPGQACGASGCEPIEIRGLPDLVVDAGNGGDAVTDGLDSATDTGTDAAMDAFDARDAADVPTDVRVDVRPADVCPPATPAACGGVCTNVSIDRANCGACGINCLARANVMAADCAGSVCTNIRCNAGFGDCDASRVNGCEISTSTSTLHCGGCGRPCGVGAICTVGVCGCPAGQTGCGAPARCVDTRTDNANCGTCGTVCAMGATCTAGTCACPMASPTVCTGTCVDTQTNTSHCGACGARCMPTFACVMGACACPATAPTVCGTACANTMTDPANCGACATACMVPTAPGTAATCSAGVCGVGCMPGLGDCDGDTMNGCETDVRTSMMHCGACGNACPMGQMCLSGVCRAFSPVDVTVLLDVTGSNVPLLTAAVSALQTRLVAPLLALADLNVGVSYTCEFPVSPYGAPTDRPFQGATEPGTAAATINTAIGSFPPMMGGDAADGMVEALATLSGRPIHPTSLALTCSAGRAAGGCWRAGARRVIVLFTDDQFHNGPDPASAMALLSPYVGISPAPAIWPDVLAAMRATNTVLLIMNSNAMGAASPGAPQYTRMLTDLGQPVSDAFLSTGAAGTMTAADAVVARIRVIRGM